MGKDWREVHVATFSGLYKAQIRTPTTADNFLLKKKKKGDCLLTTAEGPWTYDFLALQWWERDNYSGEITLQSLNLYLFLC